VSDIESIAGPSEPVRSPRGMPNDSATLESRPPEREGLPREYRMRAETHYVDQLGSQSGTPPVRTIDVDQLATSQTWHPADLRPLVESIRTHGVVHPLLVARSESGYAVIAGHKRLAAARVLRLTAVPCFVHAVDEERATLLAHADNLQAMAAARPDATATRVQAVRQAIAQHLTAVHASAALIETSPPHLARAAIDLVSAHSWRAARLLEVLDAGEKRSSRAVRQSSLASAVERTVEGFATEGRLSGVDVRARIEGAAAGVKVDHHDVSLIVSSGVLATLPLVDHTHIDRPAILVTASRGAAGHVRLAIEQSSVPSPGALATRFFDEHYADRSGGWCAVACAMAVKAVAERMGGAAAFSVDAHGGSSLAVDLPCL
jgi:ParB/RepB/Spo0J family partition protein